MDRISSGAPFSHRQIRYARRKFIACLGQRCLLPSCHVPQERSV